MEIRELHYTAPGTVPYVNASKRVWWGAIFAGAFVAAASTLLLRGLGFLFATVPAPPAGMVRALHIGTAIWWAVSGAICYYAGGWTAGRLTGIARVDESVIHGFVSWALATASIASIASLSGGFPAGIAAGAMATRGTWFYAFVIMCVELAASCIGAANGTRLLVPSDVVSREAAEAHHQASRQP